MKRKYTILIFFIILFLVTSFLSIFAVQNIGNIETLYIGTVAKDLTEGLIMPFWDYQFSSYDGGTLACAVIAVPFFWLFGQTVFALALVAVLFSLATFVLWYLFFEKYFSRSAANLAALMFICAPPLFTRYSVVTAGNHSQAGFFVILFLLIFYKIFFSKRTRRDPVFYGIHFFSLGIVAGFGTWFCYSFLVTLLVCFIFWWAWDKILIKRINYFIFFGAFLIGYSPAFPRFKIFASLVKEEIFEQVLFNSFIQLCSKFRDTITLQLPISFFFEKPIIAWLYYIISVTLFLSLCWKNRNSFKRLALGIFPLKRFKLQIDNILRESPILIYPFVYILIYSLSNFNIIPGDTNYLHYRYFLPLFPFIFGIIALGINYLLKSKINFIKITGACVIIFILFLGVSSSVNLLKFSNLSDNFETNIKGRGFSYEMLGTVICWRFQNNPGKSIELLNRVNKKYILDAYRGFGFEFSVLGENDPGEYLKLIEDPRYRAEFYKGVGLGIAHRYFGGTELRESYFSEILRDDACKEFLVITEKGLSLINRFEEKYKAGCYKAMGMQFVILCNNNPEKYLELIEQIDSWYRAEFYKGIDLGLAYR